MKIKDITEWSGRWSTPRGTMDSNAPVADGVLVDLSLWGTSVIGLAVQCPDGKYFGSIRAPIQSDSAAISHQLSQLVNVLLALNNAGGRRPISLTTRSLSPSRPP
jgi:hypothetical protein